MKKSKLLLLILTVTLASTALLTNLSSQIVKAASRQATRIGGSDRYQTAAQVAVFNWTTANNVVLVSGEGYSDAISASLLAKKLNAPILLTTSKTLNSYTKTALDTLKPKKIYIIGGNASVSKEIRDSLKGAYKLVELGGANRYETNVAVAKKLIELGLDPYNTILVGGEDFSDALSVASIAAAKGEILLLGSNDLDYIKPITSFINDNKSNVTVVGTNFVINDNTYKAINGVNRISGGTDRFDTNLKVLSAFKNDVKTDKIYVANTSGDGYADALVASVLAGKDTAPLLLVDNETSKSTSNAIDYLKSNLTASSDIQVLGGVGVLPESIVTKINASIPADNTSANSDEQTFTGYITTEDDFASSPSEDTADMVYMKMMAQSGLGITFQQNGKWVFYYLDGNIATNNTKGEGGKWIFDGTGSQLKAWNIVESQIKGGDGESSVPVTVTGILSGNTQTNPGLDADGINYPIITVKSITLNK